MQWLFDLLNDYPILWLIALGVVGQALSPNPKKAREKARRRRAEEGGVVPSDKEDFLGQVTQPRQEQQASVDREDEVARQIRAMLSGGGSSEPSEPKMVIHSEPEPIVESMPRRAVRPSPVTPSQAEPSLGLPSGRLSKPLNVASDEPLGGAFVGIEEFEASGLGRGPKERASLRMHTEALVKETTSDFHKSAGFAAGDLTPSTPPPAPEGGASRRGSAILKGLDAKQAVRAMLILGAPRSMTSLERDNLSPWAYRQSPEPPLPPLDDQ